MRNAVARVARIIGLLSLLVALAGCSALRLGYSTLPDVAFWWLDGYLDFDDAQEQRVREDITRVHAWHRANELPQWIQLLGRIEQLAAADTTPERVCAFEPDLRRRWLAVREQLEPVIVANASTLGPAQMQQLQRKYARNVREFERDWLRVSPAEQLDKRVKQAQERMETMYGTLTDGQRAALRQQLERTPYQAERILQERRRRQQDVMAVLRRLSTEQVPAEEARTIVRALFDRMLTSPDPTYRAYQEALRLDTCRLVAQVHNTAGPAQREHAVRRLRSWQRDLQELAGRS
ncbi:MAG TPA: DUF6279 family lipoprotein [Ramlibacter sp.]|nr:DUF6279 family lipoprotein [Ramlibacter sp.]